MTVLAAVGAAIMAGLLFAFSNFVMTSLSRLPAASGMEAMQYINVDIVNPVFLVVFVGTSALSLIILIAAVTTPPVPPRTWLVLAAGLYLLGVIGVTAVFNIPLNNSIANLPAAAADTAWPAYVQVWLRWNHVRSFAAVCSVACYAISAYQLGRTRL